MSKKPELKSFPVFESDEEAERFVDEADLSEYDWGKLVPMRFEIRRKDVQVNIRMPKPLLDAIKARAEARGIPYQRLIRETLELSLAKG